MSTPEPAAGHVPREELLQRLEAILERRFAALLAPAGFGKTTLIAAFSRAKREQGSAVAWISLDEGDTPSVFGSYLAYAFEHAGLDLTSVDNPEVWSSSPATHQIGMLARAVELHAKPCLLVLDEVDRVPRGTVELIQRLLDHGPSNLHLALTFRCDPGLDLSVRILDGSGLLLGVNEFRFSRSEIDRFFEGKLSRRQLNEVQESTAGWPVALMVYRSEQARATQITQITSDFVRVRLLRGLSAEDRKFVCELAVFDWIDPEVVDEVLETSGARVRINGLRPLDGLLAPIGEHDEVRRLHPLARDHCIDLLTREDPLHKRSLHVRIARALTRRGHFLDAWRHARSAGDDGLVGELVERAGVFEMWLRYGVARLLSANEFLTAEITASYPRLALLRSAALAMALKADQAFALFESVGRSTDGFTKDREGGDAGMLALDQVFTRFVLAGGSHRALHDDLETLLPTEEVAGVEERGRLLLGARSIVLCGSCYERARFDECRQHAASARTHFGEDKRYVNIVLDIYLGMAAMAQGRVREAADCYARALRETRGHFSSDPRLADCISAVRIELDLELYREKAIAPRTLKGLSELRATWTDIDAAAVAVSVELTLEQSGSEAVTRLLEQTQADVRALRFESLSRYVAGLLVFHLAEIGQPGQAAGVWRDEALPEEDGELLDLVGQPWRTMESMACARIRLLAAQGEFAAADALASSLCAKASEHGLLRTQLRGLALSIVAAEAAGSTDRSSARLVEFLRLGREAGYVGPLLRHREVSRAVLNRLLEAGPDSKMRETAESMVARLDRERPEPPVFSQRELQVLGEVRQGRRNREIAESLGISEPGVRFHLASIYRKTGVSQRHEAVRSVQSLGVLV